jgi:hypothetical protein
MSLLRTFSAPGNLSLGDKLADTLAFSCLYLTFVNMSMTGLSEAGVKVLSIELKRLRTLKMASLEIKGPSWKRIFPRARRASEVDTLDSQERKRQKVDDGIYPPSRILN